MDRTHYSVPVPKIDVLMEDFSNIHTLIDTLASDRGKLLESRNTWNVFFLGYDDDPRELPDIPEVVNWIEQSVEEGIPWFYFMDPEAASGALLTFMICCGADENPDYPGQYIFDRDRIMPFIRKNLDNLAEFTEEYDIPDEIGKEITDLMLHAAKKIMFGSQKQEEEHASITIWSIALTMEEEGMTPRTEVNGYTDVFLPMTVPGFRTQPQPTSAPSPRIAPSFLRPVS